MARLPDDEYQRLLPYLTTIRLRSRHVLFRPHEPQGKIYFLGGGVCSISCVTMDGRTAGVALVGNEGMIGLKWFGGDPESGMTATVEVSDGEAQAMEVTVFRREMERRTALYDLVDRYAQAFAQGLMQSVVCNALHLVERRCARCLLEIRDRIDWNQLPVAQNAVADILGVRRASITLAAAALERERLIEHAQRRIIISNRPRLAAAACECYGIIKGHFARLCP